MAHFIGILIFLIKCIVVIAVLYHKTASGSHLIEIERPFSNRKILDRNQ